VINRVPLGEKTSFYVQIAPGECSYGILDSEPYPGFQGERNAEKTGSLSHSLKMHGEENRRGSLPPEALENPFSVKKSAERRRILKLFPVEKEKFLHIQ